MTQQIPKEIAEEGLVPIVVGVTGHRDIKQQDKCVIQSIFLDLDNKYPNTPIVVLSPLADGADRVVAKIALKTKRQDGTYPILVCPLPLPRDLYERDFETKESKDEFDALIKQSVGMYAMPFVEGNTRANTADYGENRDLQYKEVGIYIARQSHILIALWDPKRERIIGGTTDIVQMRHEGTLKGKRNPLDEIDNLPIYHILPGQKGSCDEQVRARRIIFPGMDLYPPAKPTNQKAASPEKLKADADKKKKAEKTAKQKAEAFHNVLSRLDTFNSGIKRINKYYVKEIKKNRGYIIPDDKMEGLNTFARRLLRHYAVADTLAVQYQVNTRNIVFLLFMTALSALAFFEIYAHLTMEQPLMLLGYPLSLLMGLLVYRLARWRNIQSKHLDYRALAEGLRVQFFWHLSGLKHEVVDLYLRKQKSELDWIKNAVRSVNTPLSGAEYDERQNFIEDSPDRLKLFVWEHWIKDQARYFERTAKKNKKSVEWRHGFALTFFGAGILLSIVLIILHSNSLEHPHEEGNWFLNWHHRFIVAMGILPALAAAISGYTEKMAVSAQAKRYHWMSGIFTRAQTGLDDLLNCEEVNNEEVKTLIFEVGKEALEENADWLIIKRERKLEMPTGG